MIKLIIELLNTNDFYGVHEVIDIAKGRYKAPESFKEIKQQFKRQING